MATEEDDLESYWADLREPPPQISLSRNDLPSILEAATAKTQADILVLLRKNNGEVLTPDLFSSLIAKGTQLFWHHMTTGAKAIDTVGLIEVILSVQNLPAVEMKAFIRALPRTLLERIVQSELGATAGGIHALLSLEVLYRDGRENDYALTSVAGGTEVRLTPRARPNEQLQFRLDESFSLAPPDGGVPSTRAEPPNANDH